MIQSVLFQSPYSGCCKFSGWKTPPCPQVNNSCWPSPYNAPGALACVDRVSRPKTGPQNVQQVSFRPSLPYPGYIRGPGNEPLKPMPSAWTQKVGKVPYNLRPIAGPSSTGAWTYGIVQGCSAGGGIDFVVGTAGQSGQGHFNLGLA